MWDLLGGPDDEQAARALMAQYTMLGTCIGCGLPDLWLEPASRVCSTCSAGAAQRGICSLIHATSPARAADRAAGHA
jgi:hypothetical protein